METTPQHILIYRVLQVLGFSREVLGFLYLLIGVDVERVPRVCVCVGVYGRERIKNEKWSGVCLVFLWRPRGEERVSDGASRIFEPAFETIHCDS